MRDIRSRIGELPKVLGIKAKVFYESISLSNTAYYQLKSGESKPSYDTLERILEVYPEVSGDWLLSGNGQPLKTESAIVDKKELLFDYRNLVEKVSELETALKKLQDQFGGK